MGEKVLIYHGSQQIVRKPDLYSGKAYNDYSRGFYCTASIELAKEWACPVKNDGYANVYELDLSELNVIRLSDSKYSILNWIAILLKNRHFDIDSNVGSMAREYILENFMPDLTSADLVIGYRADDSYFSFAEDFVNNVISLRDLSYVMHLGELGEQIVLVSEKAFDFLDFKGFEISDYEEYYYKREARDSRARQEYRSRKKSLEMLKEDIFILDIIREEMRNDDARLRPDVSE